MIYKVFLFLRWVPVITAYLSSCRSCRQLVQSDAKRWSEDKESLQSIFGTFLILRICSRYPEFRTLLYYRVRIHGGQAANCLRYVAQYFCPGEKTLRIIAKDIGGGLRIQHGFSTIIDARSIGSNCWINQQVTIGYTNRTDCPVIGNNVIISAGAKVIGGITIGDNVVIGANAVVVKDVPPNCTVVGAGARIVRQDDLRVDQPL